MLSIDGMMIPYEGGRTADEIYEWLASMENPVKKIDNSEEYRQTQ